MPTKHGRTIYVAKQTFVTILNGVEVTIHKDIDRVGEGHELLRGREDMFTPMVVQYDVEQATSAPGEKRG